MFARAIGGDRCRQGGGQPRAGRGGKALKRGNHRQHENIAANNRRHRIPRQPNHHRIAHASGHQRLAGTHFYLVETLLHPQLLRHSAHQIVIPDRGTADRDHQIGPLCQIKRGFD